MKSVDKCHESKLNYGDGVVILYSSKTKTKSSNHNQSFGCRRKFMQPAQIAVNRRFFCGGGTVSAKIMARTSYKETGAREVQIPKKSLPSPSPTSSFGAFFSKSLKRATAGKTKYPLHGRLGASNAGKHEWQSGFRLVLLLQRVCEVFG